MDVSPSLVWFRHDLRLSDQPALTAAMRRGGPVVPVFIWSPEEEGGWAPGAASRWWLHHSLASLDRDLRGLGSRLVLRQGPAAETLAALAEETGATAVYWNRRYEPDARRVEDTVRARLLREGLRAESANASLLFEPEGAGSGKPALVFTPFWKRCLARAECSAPLPAPVDMPAPSEWPESLPLEALALEPAVDWASGLRDSWQPGEEGAAKLLERFLDESLENYAVDRDFPTRAATSRLSPHLRHGEISPRQIWHAVRDFAAARGRGPDAEAFLREVGWREFAYQLLHFFPTTPESPLREQFARFPWRQDADDLRAWQRGQTGYPLVDAGMRELWATGTMHNRVRMVVASFLVKDLLLPWQEGARWFWDTLVDADLGNNTLNWQWCAGCGADAAPYFRIFNPVTQSEKFDPDAEYLRRWVPELAVLPNDLIHHPWTAPRPTLAAAGIELGVTYPWPIVDHKPARERALAALATLKG